MKANHLLTLMLLSTSPSLFAAGYSLEALYERVPAPPPTSSTAAGWLQDGHIASGPAVDIQREIDVQRQANQTLMAPMQAVAAGSMPPEYARAAADPAYAEQLKARLAAMTPEQQMQEAMRYSAAFSAGARQDVVRMSQDPAAVSAAVETYNDYQTREMSATALAATSQRIDAIRSRVAARSSQIGAELTSQLQCSDGEGGCPSPAAEQHDRQAARASWERITAEYDRALVEIGKEFSAYKKARAGVIAEGQASLAPTRFGEVSKSDTNRQMLVMYHSAMLNEVEQLLSISRDAAEWAGARHALGEVEFSSAK